ncbi:S1 family peptidase [Cupriavidus necator]
MYESLYSKISAACCHINVFLGDEQISEGTGFAFTETGQVVTAVHVSAAKVPISTKEFNDPEWRIFCKFPGRAIVEYAQVLPVIGISVQGFTKPLYIDQTVLVPKKADGAAYPFIPISPANVTLGQEVFVAGFSDEVVLPFEFDRYMSRSVPGAAEFFDAMAKGYGADMANLMIKRCVVGNLRRTVASVAGDDDFTCSVFYADNGVHSGASGGPVVDSKGMAVGMITKRALTDASQASHTEKLWIPSGSTLCLGLEPVKWASAKSHAAS